MRTWKLAVWLMAFCFLFSGSALADKGKKKEKKREFRIVSISGNISVYSEKNIGRDPYMGNLPDALKLMGYPKEEIDWLNTSVMAGEYSWDEIRNGEEFQMTSGRSKVGKYIANLKRPIKVKKYFSEIGFPTYYIPECGNWVRKKEIPKPVPPVKPDPIPTPQPEPTPVTKPEPIPEPAIPPVKVVESLPVPVKRAPPPKKDECENCLEHEPIIGAYGWQNELARGYGFFGEYMLWLRQCQKNGSYALGWSPGIGFYAYYAGGSSRVSSYGWIEKGIGPEAGLKYVGETKEGLPYQWQGKLRLVWEKQEGSNSEGYRMSQDNFPKIGLYTEYLRRLDYQGKWIAGVTAEGWITMGQSITSTWSGDSPQNRSMAAINFLAQYKINDDWSVRGVFGGFYQGWDKLFGLRLIAEARYKETLMFGPAVAFFPFGLSSYYPGVSAWDLTTWTAFVRLEFGYQIRQWDAERRRERIKQVANPIAERKEGLDKKQ